MSETKAAFQNHSVQDSLLEKQSKIRTCRGINVNDNHVGGSRK